MLPQLAANITANMSVGPIKSSPSTSAVREAGKAALGASRCETHTFPLTWGEELSYEAIKSFFSTSFGELSGRPRCDLIVAADVVYHEHLIDPFIETLVSLTDNKTGFCTGLCGSDGSEGSSATPPLVLISYVQRFKRAKRFLSRARRWFDIETISLPGVIDYDVLNWNRSSKVLHVSSSSADWAAFPVAAGQPEPVSCAAYHYILARKQ